MFIFVGMPNASIPTPQPVKQRKMFGAYGKSVGAHSVVFVSQVIFQHLAIVNILRVQSSKSKHSHQYQVDARVLT